MFNQLYNKCNILYKLCNSSDSKNCLFQELSFLRIVLKKSLEFSKNHHFYGSMALRNIDYTHFHDIQ